ncbi:MAG: hypothetical protein Q4A84_08820 [Neisseria sp.]|uniref:hypothetical protein n=1 Tax=Neisseria sp. TaxID=192066 RepID=UPI0026DCF66D|nr:hypothetical protein [Neisseria sp.]MDO4641778.1 hypothetical protein [Neisseria sp.]
MTKIPQPINEPTPVKKSGINPVLLMAAIALIAAIMSYVLPSGEYQRKNKMVVPGTYQVLEKDFSLSNILVSPADKPKTDAKKTNEETEKIEATATSGTAPHVAKKIAPISISGFFMSIPEGIAKLFALVVMVLFVGGMFGILNKSGMVEAWLQRVLAITGNNIYVLVPVLMLIFSAGTTFLGFSKEYVLMIPLVVALCNQMGLSNLVGLAIVALGNQIGHIASITNPYILPVAQPMLGLPVFSGIGLRVATYVITLLIGIGFVLWYIKKNEQLLPAPTQADSPKLSFRHSAMLWIMVIGIGFLVYAANHLG